MLRHRFTTRYLEELLKGAWRQDQPASPHKILNAYICQITTFEPRDVDDEAILENEQDIEHLSVPGFRWDRIEEGKTNYSIRRH